MKSVVWYKKASRTVVTLLAIFFVCFNVPSSSAQTAGTILGTVSDSSGAVVANVEITVRQVETGIVHQAVAGSSGEYRVPGLAPGTYEVSAKLTGFQQSVRKGVTLTVGREAVVDFSLQVGDVAQQVTVTSEVPLIETTNATISGGVNPEQIRELPLNARSFLELAPLTAGVVISSSPINDTYRGFGTKLSVVGTRGGGNDFLLDGASITDATGTVGSAASTLAGVETVREFRMITNAYDAEYGKHTGAIMVAATRSGANQFHGSIFEFLRNDKLDTRNFFDKRAIAFKRNQFGGVFGGPIIKDKLFFFGGDEALRARLGTSVTTVVPGAAMRNGILNGVTVGVDPKVKPFLDSWPVANNPDRADGTALLVTGYSKNTNQNTTTGRIDYQVTKSDSFFGRVSTDGASFLNPQASRVNFADNLASSSRYITLEESHIFSPSLLSRTNFSFIRTVLGIDSIIIPGYTVPAPYSCAGTTSSCGINVTGLTGYGSDARHPAKTLQNMFQFRHDINYSTGRHSVKFGFQFERFQFNQIFSFNSGGSFTFNSPLDFLQNNVARFDVVTPGGDGVRHWRQNLMGLYVHDDIRLTPRFTVNIGLRYEFITVPKETNGKIATIRNPSPTNFPTITPAQFDIGDPYYLNPSLKNFAPRLGFAWDPFGNSKISIRGGFGVYFDEMLPKDIILSGVQFPPFYSTRSLTAQGVAPAKINFPDAYTTQQALLAGSKPQIDLLQWNLNQPTVYKWSLDIQKEFIGNTTVDIGYSGTRGVHLMRVNSYINATPVQTQADGRRLILMGQPLPNPNLDRVRYHSSDSESDYHAFLLTVNKKIGSRATIHGSYTFSKSTDDSSGWVSADYTNDQSGYMSEKMHALSAFDIRQSLYVSGNYDLPGQKLGGAAGGVLGGWSLTSLLRLNSGNPISIVADRPTLGNVAALYVFGSVLNLVPGGNQNAIRPQNPDHYIDVSQFQMPQQFYMGNLGRNVLTTPGIVNMDMNLVKSTRIPKLGENTNLQFRAEVYNLFNRPNFGPPAASLFDRFGVVKSNAGQITTTSTPSRQIQVALKIVF